MNCIKFPKNLSVSICFIFIMLLGCKQSFNENSYYKITKSVTQVKAGVVSAHPLATSVGLDILKKGGNAVDAAIAVQFALAVVYPNAGNIGGGGFFLYRDKNGRTASLDFREKAPSKAFTEMYLDSLGNPMKDASLYGAKAAGVPGTVDGMIKIFEKYSQRKDWALLLNPAIELATKGFPITTREAENLNKTAGYFKRNNDHVTSFQKDTWKAGDLLVQKDLAATLEAVKEKGRAGFYEGEVAEKIVKSMKKNNGIISLNDLKDYQSVWRNPLSGNYRGYTVHTMPPPSSGGIALLQLLEMIEPFPVNQMKFQSPEHVHLFTEAERRVYADRAKHLGDPDFYEVPVKQLLDSMYIVNRMSNFQPRQKTPSDSISFGLIEKEETTHFSIVDAEGNAVSVTTTLNGSYGSFHVVNGAGFLLNNEMDDFSVKPGHPNLYGLVGYEANKIEPGKRMLSSMTPTIIEKEGKLFMVVGTPGGSTIITSVFQVVSNVIDFKMNISEAVQSARFHHQWKPDCIFYENKFDTATAIVLQSIGHTLTPREPIGRVEAILVDEDGSLFLAADGRGDDDAKGIQ